MTPAQVIELESIVAETIAEIEADKIRDGKESTSTTTTPIDRNYPRIRLIDTIRPDMDIEADSLTMLDSIQLQDADTVQFENRIYGQHLFKTGVIPVYKYGTSILPNEAYRIGTGDEMAISIYGASQFEGQFVVDQAGYIYPSRLPRIF